MNEQRSQIQDQVDHHEKLLLGEDGNFGIVHKVNIIWRIHTWLLCTLSGIAGFALSQAMKLFVK